MKLQSHHTALIVGVVIGLVLAFGRKQQQTGSTGLPFLG